MQLRRVLSQTVYDAVVAFNRIPPTDLYYAADVCYGWRMRRRPPWLAWLPRYRTFLRFERELFASSGNQWILYLSDVEKARYQEIYGTPERRFRPLPPGLDKAAIRRPLETEGRDRIRRDYGLASSELLLLMIGSDFRRKGVDRAIAALAALPSGLRERTRLWIIGKGHRRAYQLRAARCGVGRRVRFLGGRDDAPRFLAAADLLLHPARSENTGNVLLEAMVAGVPVLATGICGYAGHVAHAQAGCVLSEPFDQSTMNRVLSDMLSSPHRDRWRDNAYQYTERVDLYSRPETAVNWIEEWVKEGKGHQP